MYKPITAHTARYYARPLISGLATALLLAASLATSPALAADGKDYPGALCQPRLSTYTFDRATIGRVFNTSTSPQTWICPHVHDINGDYVGQITVIDMHLDADVTCTLYSRTRTGSFVDAAEVKSAGTNPAPQPLITKQVKGEGNGYAFFNCTVPGMYDGEASGIVSYEVTDQ
jgi:hypothetical protein